ncbi:hypothetical protein [Paenibacillus pinihumi]|uniref:hypothetical protein n=1 Tax=Paenibacillus pinihumi TaxID=669462 RepID=UPI00040831BC|nr:hypothetical protein [Paenibacillus pinihumi]
MRKDELQVNQQSLLDAWQETLPRTLNAADSAEVKADEADENSLRIHIRTAGHQEYTFDFKVEYVDSREIRTELVDVERSGKSIDERTGLLQELIQDYTRHLHECAQALHQLTHA